MSVNRSITPGLKEIVITEETDKNNEKVLRNGQNSLNSKSQDISVPLVDVRREFPISSETNVSTQLESLLMRLESVADKLSTLSFVDSYEQFGKYIVSLLRSLPEEKVHFLMKKIVDDVIKVKFDKENQSFSVKDRFGIVQNNTQSSTSKKDSNNFILDDKVNYSKRNYKRNIENTSVPPTHSTLRPNEGSNPKLLKMRMSVQKKLNRGTAIETDVVPVSNNDLKTKDHKDKTNQLDINIFPKFRYPSVVPDRLSPLEILIDTTTSPNNPIPPPDVLKTCDQNKEIKNQKGSINKDLNKSFKNCDKSTKDSNNEKHSVSQVSIEKTLSVEDRLHPSSHLQSSSAVKVCVKTKQDGVSLNPESCTQKISNKPAVLDSISCNEAGITSVSTKQSDGNQLQAKIPLTSDSQGSTNMKPRQIKRYLIVNRYIGPNKSDNIKEGPINVQTPCTLKSFRSTYLNKKLYSSSGSPVVSLRPIRTFKKTSTKSSKNAVGEILNKITKISDVVQATSVNSTNGGVSLMDSSEGPENCLMDFEDSLNFEVNKSEKSNPCANTSTNKASFNYEDNSTGKSNPSANTPTDKAQVSCEENAPGKATPCDDLSTVKPEIKSEETDPLDSSMFTDQVQIKEEHIIDTVFCDTEIEFKEETPDEVEIGNKITTTPTTDSQLKESNTFLTPAANLELTSDQQSNLGIFTCSLCSSAFYNYDNFVEHKASEHTKNRPEKCIYDYKKRRRWDPNQMAGAVSAVRENLMGYQKASREFQVPRSSLARFVKCREPDAELAALTPLGRRPVFSKHMEQELVKYLIEMKSQCSSFKQKDICTLAFHFAVKNNIPHTFRGNDMAGRHWFRNFMKRNRDKLL